MFDTNSAELKDKGLEKIQEFAMQLLSTGTPQLIKVIGHTDSSGSDVVNQELSLARAIAVKEALIAGGMDNTVILVSGVGASMPIANNDLAEGRALNRRVEVRVTHTKQVK